MSSEQYTSPITQAHVFRYHRLIRAISTFNWKYVLIEFLIVVAGILSAFAWNSYWEHGDQATRARVYLDQIIVEPNASEANLDQVLSSMRKRLYATAQLSRASFSLVPPQEDQLRKWFLTNMYYETPSLTTGTLRALISSGDIHLIHDQALKTKLSSTADRITQYENWARNQMTEWLLPAWHEMNSFAGFTSLQLATTPPDTVTARALLDSTYLLPPAPRKDPFPINLARELNNPAFHDLVIDTYGARFDLLKQTDAIRQAIIQIRVDITHSMEAGF